MATVVAASAWGQENVKSVAEQAKLTTTNRKKASWLRIYGMGPNPTPPEDRFWSKVDKDGPIPEYNPELGSCWMWTGALSNGYGNFYVRKGVGDYAYLGAHKFSYELENGVVDEGMEVDHLCRVRKCVRPSHLEAVTTKENLFRRPNSESTRTACPQGHKYDGANTYYNANGSRKCRECACLYKRKIRGVQTVITYKTQRRIANG